MFGFHQRGVVLVLALVFLLMSTLLATGAVSQALWQERMAGGQRHALSAAIAAESALRGVEWELWKGGAMGPLRCGSAPLIACYDIEHPDVRVRRFRQALGWVVEGAAEYRGGDGRHDFTTLTRSGLDEDARRSAVLAKNPVYLVEDLGPVRPAGASTAAVAERHVYRITARAVGGDANIVRVMESVFAVGGD